MLDEFQFSIVDIKILDVDRYRYDNDRELREGVFSEVAKIRVAWWAKCDIEPGATGRVIVTCWMYLPRAMTRADATA